MSKAQPCCSSADEADPRTERLLQLLGAHERKLFSYVYSLTANWQDAEEVMQRLRIRIWQQFDEYDDQRPFAAWARAIAYYLVLAYREEKGRRREFFAGHVIEAISHNFETHQQRTSDRRDALVRCLEKLDGRKRALVNDYYAIDDASGGRSTEDIASRLSMTPNALRQAMFRIRKVLLECVERTVRSDARG